VPGPAGVPAGCGPVRGVGLDLPGPVGGDVVRDLVSPAPVLAMDEDRAPAPGVEQDLVPDPVYVRPVPGASDEDPLHVEGLCP
jgi:hypothetical protein